MRYMRKLHPYLDILVSNIGEVFVPRGHNIPAHWTFGTKNHAGYRQVCIAGKVYKVHRLVAQTFLGEIPEGYQIDHANRVRDDNRLENLRIVTPNENRRNRADHDRVTEQGRTHTYEDAKKAAREYQAHYYAENKDKVREQQARYYAENKDKIRVRNARYRTENKDKIRERNARYSREGYKTHKHVRFADGSRHYIPLAEADAYLIIPLKERFYHAK